MTNIWWFSFIPAMLVILLFAYSCDKEDGMAGIPACVQEKIAALEQEDCPSVGQVYRYSFQGRIVYVIHPRQCGADLTSAIVDENCNTLCHLGGITGNQKCEGVDFMEHATDEELVYP